MVISREDWTLRGPRSSSFWVLRNLSHHMIWQARPGDTELVKNRDMTGRAQRLPRRVTQHVVILYVMGSPCMPHALTDHNTCPWCLGLIYYWMYTKHRNELRHSRKTWPGTLVDPCLHWYQCFTGGGYRCVSSFWIWLCFTTTCIPWNTFTRCPFKWIRSAEGLEHLTVNAKLATVLDSFPASSGTDEGRKMK